jgi:hypothetical protein
LSCSNFSEIFLFTRRLSRLSTSPDQFTRRYRLHLNSTRPLKKEVEYFRILRRLMRFRFQRIRNQVNQRFLQVVIAKTPKGVRSEIFWIERSTKVKRA